MSIVVTAATGHLGRLVVEALLEGGTAADQIVATTRDTERLDDLAARGVVVRRADYSDPQSLKEAFAGADKVLLISSGDPGNRVVQHRNAIEAAVAVGVDLLAYTSILRASTSTILLAEDHAATEQLIIDSGLRHSFLRNSWYLENYTEQLGAALEHHAVLGSAGEGRVSAASRADYAAAAAAVLTLEGPIASAYELAGDTAFTLAEYAAALTEIAGEAVAYVDQPVEDFAAFLGSVGLPEPMPAVLADADLGLSRGELYDESGTLSTLIGRPTTTLVDAIRAALG
jgi:NAD(P)H dehydrogenase (quinone)